MRVRTPIAIMLGIFIAMHLMALALVQFYPTDYRAFQDTSSPVNPLIYIIMLLTMTAFILIMLRYGLGKVIRAIFLGAAGISCVFVLYPLVYQMVPDLDISFYLSIAISAVLVVLMIFKAEWYIVNAVGFIVGVGAAIILGISLSVLPVMILLIVLAVYDAISVYKTKHMISLAEGVVPLRLPVIFIIPKNKGFKMSDLDNKPLTGDSEEREAMFMGVGDAVIPAILTISAAVFLPMSANGLENANYLVALGVVTGSALGFFALMRFVLKGNPQAGLPLLNGGAIGGYLLTYLLVFQSLNLGMF